MKNQAEKSSSSLECNIVAKAQESRNKVQNYFWKFWSIFGLPYFWILLGIIFLILGNFMIPALFLVLVMSYVLIIAPLKILVKRPRPQEKCDNVHSLVSKTKYSFPSGHTFFATSFGLIIAFYFGELFWFIVIFSLGFMVGASRIYLGAHFLSDVVFSYMIAILVVIIIFWVLFPLITLFLTIIQGSVPL